MVVAATIWKCMGPMLVASHDVQVVETQYGSPQEEQVFREAAVVEATTGVKGTKKRSKNTVVRKRVVQNIAVRKIAVTNTWCKNKTVIKNNPHGSYLI